MDPRPGCRHAPTTPVRQLDRSAERTLGQLGPSGERCEPSEWQRERSVAADGPQLRRLVDVRLEVARRPVGELAQPEVGDELGLEEGVATARVPLADAAELGPGERRLGPGGVAEGQLSDRNPAGIGELGRAQPGHTSVACTQTAHTVLSSTEHEWVFACPAPTKAERYLLFGDIRDAIGHSGSVWERFVATAP